MELVLQTITRGWTRRIAAVVCLTVVTSYVIGAETGTSASVAMDNEGTTRTAKARESGHKLAEKHIPMPSAAKMSAGSASKEGGKDGTGGSGTSDGQKTH